MWPRSAEFVGSASTMSYVVDGSEWQFDGWTEEKVAQSIDAFLALIDISRQREELVWIGDDFESRPMLGANDLWTIASRGGVLNLAPEIIQELAAWLGRAPRYLDQRPWPHGMENISISISGAPMEDNIDVAWAHHSVREGTPMGCLGLSRSGLINTHSALGEENVYWINSENDRKDFWRNAIIDMGDNAESLRRFASHAYPEIFFSQGALGGLSDLAGGYLTLRQSVRRSFEILNDHGYWAFTFPPPALSPGEPMGADPLARPSNQIIQNRFAGFHVDMAPENPNVYNNLNCREAREVQIGSGVLYCEWHIKLEPHRNRIHIHAPVAASNNKLVVAIITEHLPLP